MILRFDRILALCRRLIYVYLRSNFRILDLVFWPVMDLVVWGFVSVYFMRLGSDAPPHAVTFLIGSVVFYNILMRAQQSISVSFLEDVCRAICSTYFCRRSPWRSLSLRLISLVLGRS